MSHILCITTGLTGILNASFELASRLENEGYQVTLAAPLKVQEKVKLQGFNFLQLPPVVLEPAPELPPSLANRKWKRLVYKYRNLKKRRKEGLNNLGMEAFGKLLDQVSADLIIIDVELHEHIMTVYSRSEPLILLSQWFSLWKRRGLPPLLHTTIPVQGWKGNWLAIEYAWLKIKLGRGFSALKRKLTSGYTDRRSILQLYAKKIGFPLKYIRDNFWPGPFTYNSLPVLSMTAFEMEFPYQPQPELHYIGPMVYAERKDTEPNPNVSSIIERILQKKKTENSILIYCTVSTLKKGDQAFLKRLVDAVKGQPNWLLVIGMGGMLDRNFLEPIPENVYPFSWVPQLLMLQHADCSINHGGIHTIHECLHFKVPMLIYSGKRSDQNGCAARVAYHQLGIVADKDLDSSEIIRSRIQQLLSEKTYENQVSKMHQHYLDYKERAKLNNLVLQYMNGS